jgi:hypothetical protein
MKIRKYYSAYVFSDDVLHTQYGERVNDTVIFLCYDK